MQKIAAVTIIVLLATCFPVGTCIAEQHQGMEEFYQSLRDNTYADYQKALQMSEAERQRKAKEKLPPVSPEVHAQALSAMKFLLYNKAMFSVICAEAAVNKASASVDEDIKTVHECVSTKTGDMMKYLKLGDYADTLGTKKFVGCEIKARDFRRESRFPPFDFLRDPKGPRILDFAAANKCITSEL